MKNKIFSNTLLARFLVILLINSIITLDLAGQSKAVVEINSFLPSGGIMQGTGFFFRDNSSIITAYHVIQGAEKITVIVQNETGSYTNVLVEYISTKYDIAMLHLPDLEKSIASIPLAKSNYVPPLSESLMAIGYPRMGVQHNMRTYLTTQGYISSKTVFDHAGQQVFNENIDILPITLVNYSGMSGAPIISNNGVIGVFSGSYDEGGALGWIIPTKYLASMELIHKRAENIPNWKPLTLMSSNFKDLRRSINLNSYTSNLLQSFLDNTEALSNNYNKLNESSSKLKAGGQVLQMVLETTPLNESFEDVIEPIINPILNDLETFEKACYANDEINIRLNRNLADIINWISSESKLDISQKNKALSRLDQISMNYSEITKTDYFTKIGVSDSKMKEFLTVVTKMPGANTPYEFKIALQDFSVAIQNFMMPYQSTEAYLYSSKDIARLRSYAKVFMETTVSMDSKIPGLNEEIDNSWILLDGEKFMIKYPDYWHLDQSGQHGTTFMLFPKLYVGKDNFRENLNLTVGDVYGYYTNVDQYANALKLAIPNYYDDAQVLEQHKSSGNASGYARLIFSGTYESHSVIWEQYYYFNGGKVYVLTFVCDRDQFDIYKETAEKIMGGLKFKNTSSNY